MEFIRPSAAAVHKAQDLLQDLVTPSSASDGRVPPISFRYGGRSSTDLFQSWPVTLKAGTPLPEVSTSLVSRVDPDTGLECEIEAKWFDAYPAVEWVVRFRNKGTADTPILEDVQPLCTSLLVDNVPVLHRSRGARCSVEDFLLVSDEMLLGVPVHVSPGEGRSSSQWLPFFNLQDGGQGTILAIGWTGCWAAMFKHTQGKVAVSAGMDRTHLTLHPGEEIRTPGVLVLFWDGDVIAGHNLLRHLILDHHSLKHLGKRVEAPLCAPTWGGMRTPDHLERIQAIEQHRLDYDYYWVDAGWYGPPESYSPDEHKGDWWQHVGDWKVNPVAHPGGLRPISDAARAAGMKFLLWVEPERAMWGTPLSTEHPDWFLGDRTPGSNLLLNLGKPEVRQWMTNFISGLITEHGLNCYRQDFNIDPLPYWRSADEPDRQGITEIRHIEGLYAFWDELLARHPGLLIDNCASGGRRIDIETLGRSIPLWRSDLQCFPGFSPTGAQIQSHGLSHWVPVSACGTQFRPDDTYNVRSALSAGLAFSIFPYEYEAVDPDYPWDWHRDRINEFRRAQPFFAGDYYPLLRCHDNAEDWWACQWNLPENGEAMLLVFRREDSPFVSAEIPLKGLSPHATYQIMEADTDEAFRLDGWELLDTGLPVTLGERRSSTLYFLREV